MSEAELHLIRSRLTAGLRHKAARGELRQFLPVGFDYDETGAVIITPDEAVVEAIATVFRRFAELGTGRQVLLSLRGDGLLLPRRPTRTGRVSWAPATYPAVHDFLTNPVYAGAFVFGRTRTEKRVDATGTVVLARVVLPREQWAVLIPDHHRRVHRLGHLRGQHRPAAGELAGAARVRRRRAAGRIGAAAGPAAVRQVRPDDADRLLRQPRATAPAICAPARNSCMAARQAARASADAGWRTGSWRRCSPCWSRPRWPRPRRRSPTPNKPIAATLRDLRAGRRTGPLRSRPGPPPIRRGRAGEPARRPHPGTGAGGQAGRAAAGRTRPARRPGPPTRPAHRRRAGLAVSGRRRRAGDLHRADHHVPGTQTAAARRHRRGRRHRRHRRPEPPRCGSSGRAAPAPS